jgi:hypothetical protein
MVHRIREVQTNAAGHDFFSGSIFEGTANLANGLSFTPLALRVVPELDCPDVSANSVVMAASRARLSGIFFWHWRMALILLRSGRFATIWTRRGQCHAA